MSFDVDVSKRWPAMPSSGEPNPRHTHEPGAALHKRPGIRGPEPTAVGLSSPDQRKARTVLLPHALTLGQARSYIAALADQADSIDASSAYEHVLIELDRMHGDESPVLDTAGICEDRAILLAVASSAIEELEQYGVDPLTVELVLAMLDDAHGLDGT